MLVIAGNSWSLSYIKKYDKKLFKDTCLLKMYFMANHDGRLYRFWGDIYLSQILQNVAILSRSWVIRSLEVVWWSIHVWSHNLKIQWKKTLSFGSIHTSADAKFCLFNDVKKFGYCVSIQLFNRSCRLYLLGKMFYYDQNIKQNIFNIQQALSFHL